MTARTAKIGRRLGPRGHGEIVRQRTERGDTIVGDFPDEHYVTAQSDGTWHTTVAPYLYPLQELAELAACRAVVEGGG